MTMTLNEAAKSCRKAKGTILKAIKEGRLSAPKDAQGRYEIDPSELHRVFPMTTADQSEKPILTTTTDHVRIPEHPATHSDNIRPLIPEYPATCDALP